MNVVSLGAGVQSSTMVLMAARGLISPMPDCAIFADTQAEPKQIYEYLDWLEKQLPFPVYRVTKGNLAQDLLAGGNSNAPFFTFPHGMLGRNCTRDYKIAPIRAKLRELVKPKRGEKEILVEQWIGISWDEMQRMKLAPDAWVTNRWPLIERQMTRLHCIEWCHKNGLKLPSRSACYFCPYHDNRHWDNVRKDRPDEWAMACEFDRNIRGALKTKSEVYVHVSRQPLETAPIWDREKEDQTHFSFMDECDGMCGV